MHRRTTGHDQADYLGEPMRNGYLREQADDGYLRQSTRDGYLRDASRNGYPPRPAQNGYPPRPAQNGYPQDFKRYSSGWALAASTVFMLAANIVSVIGVRIPFLGPTLGIWFLLLYPVYLIFTTSLWQSRPGPERLAYSLASVLLLLIVGGLTFNTVLPFLGIGRPLDPVPVVVLGDAINLSLIQLRRRRPGSISWNAITSARTPQETRFIGGSVFCVVLATLGATRLNNGAGPLVSVLALTLGAAVVVLLLRMYRRLREGVIAATLYFVSLSLLLLTSLRGWYPTGHDIQTEYRTFQLVVAHGHWDFSLFPNAYNGCLSITILPTEMAGIEHFDNIYVYKVFFQLIFATTPVFVYVISRRYWSEVVSVLAAVYFISLPNFFTDMTYENRQEIAFVFVCAAVLSLTNSAWSQPQRRVGLLVSAVGIELSHYSTMYLFAGTMASAWVFGGVWRLLSRHKDEGARYSLVVPWAVVTRTVGIGSLVGMATIVAVWGGAVTGTAGASARAVGTSIGQLFTPQTGTSVAYSIFSRTAPSASTVLADYRKATLRVNQESNDRYIAAAVAQLYPTPVVSEPLVAITRLGRLVRHAGISVEALNKTVRQGAAKDEQLFVAVGLAAVFFSVRLRRRVTQEFFCICVGGTFVMGLFIIFPNLAANYGLLRAFQEILIVTAPLLVQGSMSIFAPFGNKWSLRITRGVAVAILVSTTGLMPQLLGGYPPQLSLNNSGVYYDAYSLHQQDAAAVAWLSGKPGVLPDGLQAPALLFAFNSPSDVTGRQLVHGIYPTLIGRNSWVLLDYAIVHHDRAMVNVGNQTVTYAYPIGMLNANKNLVYDNGSTEVYK